MGPGFVIFFWLIVAAILGAIWLGTLVLFVVAWKKRWRILKWLAGIALSGGVVVALAAGVLVTYGLVRASIPRYVFADVFHAKPTESVQDIRTKVFWFADTGSIYLRFQTDIDTFRRLVPKDLHKVTRQEFEEKRWQESNGYPSWWQSTFSSSDEIYFQASEIGHGKKFASETTWMAYDSKHQIAYYRFLGID